MAKVALDMDMPESCSKCKFLYDIQGNKKCQLMNALNNGASRLSQNTFTEKRHEKCPLRELPQRYQQSEEQGRLIKLPCKVGDTVWDNDYGRPCAYTITAFSFGECEEYICEPVTTKEAVFYYANSSGSITGSFAESEIGKSVFLNESEAEAKLKELRGAENGSME